MAALMEKARKAGVSEQELIRRWVADDAATDVARWEEAREIVSSAVEALAAGAG